MNKPDTEQLNELLNTLRLRFLAHPQRHEGIEWEAIKDRIIKDKHSAFALYFMEQTGGEPDVIGFDPDADKYIYCDCSAESPQGRRSLCYDPQALQSRKENKPNGSAIGMAQEMGVEIMDESQYRYLQTLGSFDTKTSSWLKTPDEIRKLGGAIFGDRRYNQVFKYHNGAESYYASRGFRGVLMV